MQKKSYLLPVLVAATLVQGCSFSYSSKSSSRSSASSSKSIVSILSSPSSSLTKEDIYQEEITEYTVTYLRTSQFNHASFSTGITVITTENGVTSWEGDELTLIAIGRGLRAANLPEGVFQTYKVKIAGDDALRQQMIQKGYEAE